MHTSTFWLNRRTNLKPSPRPEPRHPGAAPMGAGAPASASTTMPSELVTLIPPGTGGVRDYAEIMSRHIPSRILAPTAQTPLADYGGSDIVLNFSGYGYHPRGIPSWMVERLAQLRTRGSRIGIFFHELFTTTEPPWRSAFWLGPTQRRIAADLGNLASYWLTNCDSGAKWLRANCAPAPHRVLPVYSNVGEPAAPQTGARTDKVVIFGGSTIRSNTYRRLGQDFWRWVMEQGLSVHDIGPPIESSDYDRLRECGRIRAHGSLPAAQVSDYLLQARYGLLCYPPHLVAKSGVFAAYCAHGVCTVLLDDLYEPHDGLQPNVHYAAGLDALQNETADPAMLGAAAFAWYQPHRVEAHVQAFRALMAESA